MGSLNPLEIPVGTPTDIEKSPIEVLLHPELAQQAIKGTVTLMPANDVEFIDLELVRGKGKNAVMEFRQRDNGTPPHNICGYIDKEAFQGAVPDIQAGDWAIYLLGNGTYFIGRPPVVVEGRPDWYFFNIDLKQKTNTNWAYTVLNITIIDEKKFKEVSSSMITAKIEAALQRGVEPRKIAQVLNQLEQV